MSVVRDFAALFAGRDDAYGTVEGGCVREQVTVAHYGRHLNVPGCSLGIYPLIGSDELAEAWAARLGGPVGRHFVKWGCSDIDGASPEECWPQAVNLHNALKALDINAWIERTKSKGWHVWVFADEWLPAVVVRRALLVGHQVAGVAPSEVNPKQVDLTGKSFGNYVNLPYAHDWRDVDGRKMVGLTSGRAFDLDAFVQFATGDRNSFDVLYAAAKLYREPPKAKAVDRHEKPSAGAEELAKRLPGLAYTIWRHGPLEGRDRSGTLQRLAHLICEAELEPADALELLRDADRRWGKFADRADGEEQLVRIVEVAYR